MNPSYIVPVILVLFLVLWLRRSGQTVIARKIIEKSNKEEKTRMTELAKRFIDRECLIYSFNGTQIERVIKEVTDGAILVEKKDSTEAVNLEFVVRIREYPRNKNGKKKSIVLD